MPYEKPPLTYQEQINKLKSRGLHFENEDRAHHLLQHLSYYRFSAYLYPLIEEPKKNHKFKKGASFGQAFELYYFDRDLKALIFRELEKIEVSFRSIVTYIFAHKYGPFWYSNDLLFKDRKLHKRIKKKICDSFDNSNEQFATSFKKKYNNSIPPSWMSVETCSFGTLSVMFQNLKAGKDRRKVAESYELADMVLMKWLHSFVVVRNICAHHSRYWNSKITVAPVIPRRTKYEWIDTNLVNPRSVYFMLAMIRYMLFTINPNSSFPGKIQQLLEDHPVIDPQALGIPPSAFTQKFWK